jgi:hypothetical protein
MDFELKLGLSKDVMGGTLGDVTCLLWKFEFGGRILGSGT